MDQRVAAQSHILQIARIQFADSVGWMIQREMMAHVQRVIALTVRACKFTEPWTPKRTDWLRTQITEAFVDMMDEAEQSYRDSLHDFAIESYDWARTLLIRTLPRWYFRSIVPTAIIGEATVPNPPIVPKKIIIAKKTFDKYVAPALEVASYVEPISKAAPMTDGEWEAFAKEVIFPALTLSEIETMVESDQWRTTFPGNQSKFNDPVFRDALVRGIAGGEDVEKLTQSIRHLEAGVYWKARRTARTEALRVSEQAQRETWDDLGDMMAGAQILAVLDQNTRPEHAQRNGQIYSNDPQEGELPIDELPLVPDAPNCALPGQLVCGEILGGSKAWYAGKAIEFLCRSGGRLAVTANHPVLTQRGFIQAASVRKGDCLVRDERQIETTPVSAHDEQDCPVLIEDVFCSLEQLCGVASNESGPLDFHGDAAFFNGQVDVVAVHRELLRNHESTIPEFVGDLLFPETDIGFGSKSRFGAGHGASRWRWVEGFAATGLPGVGELALDGVGVAFDSAPFQPLLIGLAANNRTVLDQVFRESESVSSAISESAAGNAEFLGNLCDRFTGVVAFDEIGDVREFQYVGHVYDLQTVQGVYFLAGFIVHNCRCFTVPVLVPPDEIASDPALNAIFENAGGANIPDPAAYDKWFDQADEGARKLAVGSVRYNDMAGMLDGVRKPEWSDFIDPQTGSLMKRNDLARETDAEREVRKKAADEVFRQREKMVQEIASKGFLSR